MGRGRVPGRRRVLRPLRLPDHDAAPRASVTTPAAYRCAGFWSRRARRLLPALFVMLTAVCLYAANNVPDIQLDTLRGDAHREHLLLRELALHRRRPVVLRSVRQSAAAATTSGRSRSKSSSICSGRSIALGLFRLGRGTRRLLTIGTIAGDRGLTDRDERSVLTGESVSGVLRHRSTCPYDPDRLSPRARSSASAPDLPGTCRGRTPGIRRCSRSARASCPSISAAPARCTSTAAASPSPVAVAVVIAALVAPTGLLRRVLGIPPLRYSAGSPTGCTSGTGRSSCS